MFKIVSISPIVIPEGADISRSEPRSLDERQEGYEQQFDYSTLYYDIFFKKNEVILCGPPLRNLEPLIKSGKFKINGLDICGMPSIINWWKTQFTTLKFNRVDRSDSLSIFDLWKKLQRAFFNLNGSELEEKGKTSISIEVGPFEHEAFINNSEVEVFKNKKVLMTMSKNNSLEWIRDWVNFYVKRHGVNSVLFYDNNSDEYTNEELLDVFKNIKGLDVAIVVPWNFKYGPGGTKSNNWDSDFCQYSAITHARKRFLSEARGIISTDIDELVTTDNDIPVFELLDGSASGALLFSGVWIENIRVSGLYDTESKFSDFKYIDTRRNKTTNKWVIDPRRIPEDIQWNVHSFGKGFLPDIVENIQHRHFVGITNNWKRNVKPVQFNESHHVEDPRYHCYGDVKY